ncbi:MAG: hypothetical protein HKN94_16575 [Acidimicrobiales bacterium]|nr:hypothetical protein [Acidimicrobiales bacterium]
MDEHEQGQLMEADELQTLLREVADEASALLATVADRMAPGERDGQYNLDLVVDGPVVQKLQAAGLGVLSEEAGELDLDWPLVAVIDPVDGSTNASLHLPWYAFSVCVVDADGPRQSLVRNLATGEQYEAIRGGGATHNGSAMSPVEPVALDTSVVAVNDVPPPGGPWAQFRSLGASALDMCAVARGGFAAYVDFAVEAHGVWDYLGALLVCREVGLEMVDVYGRDLVVLDHTARRTPVLARPAHLDELVMLRLEQDGGYAEELE